MLGIMGIGAPYVPIDPNFPDSRIASVVEGAQADYVVVDAVTAKRFASLPYKTVDASDSSEFQPVHSVDSFDPAESTGPADSVESGVIEPGGSDLAYIIYTSGSTGNPKGVAVEHGSVSHLFKALDGVLPQLGEPSEQCWLAAANVCFDMSVVDLFWPLTRGIPLVIADIDSLAGRSREGAEFLTGVLTSGRVTHFQSTPSLVQLMLQDPALATAIRGLHVLVMGGEIVQPELVGRIGPVPHVFNGYGPTEATVYTTLHACSGEDTEQVPIGRPLHGVDLRVVDEDGRDCPPGAPGELLIGGPGLARGYLGDEELTARKFPVLGEGDDRRRWYRTGDLVSIDADTTVRYRGRADSQVKVRGFRVELGEIETAIRAVPGVEEAAVFPVRDPSGRVVGLMAAALSTAEGVSGAGVIAEVAEVLPSYAVPGTVQIFPDLPIGTTGKLDRKALERRLLRSVPFAHPPEAGGIRTPAASHEQIVAEVWGAVLGADVTIDENRYFFDLGGNSALLGSVFTRLREYFPEARLKLVEMYQYPTVSAMAERLRTGPSAAHTIPAGTPASPPSSHGDSPRPAGSRRAPLSAAERRRMARRAK